MADLAFTIGGVVVVVLIALAFITALIRLYHKSSKETAFVRTGAGGQKVIKDGGSIVIPGLHEKTEINMQTLKLEVRRAEREALITKDRQRVDVSVAFFVKVKPDEDAIAKAAQTLGDRTQNPLQLKEVIEDKFVDALRAVAASMDMDQLHEKRTEFVQSVQEAVSEDLDKNGLELESVSLTALDQTDPKFLNPNNAFDAEGLTKMTRITQEKAKERNDIEQATRVAIERKNFEANQESLKIKQEDEFVKLEQERLVETRRAEQETDLARQRAERKREADVAEIEAARATELARVDAEKAKKQAEIAAQQAIEIARQNSQVALNEKSEEESKSRANADLARSDAVKAAESVRTAEAVATAERAKQVSVIKAQEEAEREATRIRVIADANFEAAEKTAQARLKEIEADEREYAVRAEGQLAINNAANALSKEQVDLQVRKAIIEALPSIVTQMVEPMKNIDSVKIVSIPNMGALNGTTGGQVSGGASDNVPNQLVNSLLNYKIASPVIDKIAAEVGINLSEGLDGVVKSLDNNINDLHGEIKQVDATNEPSLSDMRKLAGINTSKSKSK